MRSETITIIIPHLGNTLHYFRASTGVWEGLLFSWVGVMQALISNHTLFKIIKIKHRVVENYFFIDLVSYDNKTLNNAQTTQARDAKSTTCRIEKMEQMGANIHNTVYRIR